MEKKRKMGVVKKLAAVFLVALFFVMTGCVRYEIKMTVDKDGMVDVVFTYAVWQTDSTSSSTSSLAQQKLKYLEAGYEVEDYMETDDGRTYVGFVAKLSGVTLEQEIENTKSNDLDFGTASLSVDEEGVYFLALNFDSETSQAESNGASTDLLDEYGGYMRFVLEIPGKVVESNATKVKGRTLTWDIMSMSSEFVYAKFTLTGGGSGFPMWMIGVIIGGILIIGGVVVGIMIMTNKKKAAAYSYPSSSSSSSSSNYDRDDDIDSYSPNRTKGLPIMGAMPGSDPLVTEETQAYAAELAAKKAAEEQPEVYTAPTATEPIWNRPASDADDLEDLDDDFMN